MASSNSLKRTILFVSYTYWPPDFGGELLNSVERFESLVVRGFKVKVLTSGKVGLPSKSSNNGILITRTPIVHSSTYGRALRRIIFGFFSLVNVAVSKYNTVHFGSLGLGPIGDGVLGWLCTLVIKCRGKKCIWVHSLADTEQMAVRLSGFKGFIKKSFLSNIDCIIAVSSALHIGLVESSFRSHLIPYGIRDDIFQQPSIQKRNDFRVQYGISKDSVIFSFLGSVGKRKGFDLLSESFAELATLRPNWQLWIIGPVSKNENQNINEIEVEIVCNSLVPYVGRVKFWGRIDDRKKIADIIGASDVFLFPSRQEGMGIAPLEAMAMGVPPIISRIPGVTDLANIESVTGLFVSPGNLNDLKKAMLTLGDNELLRKQMGENAIDRIKSEFSWDKFIDKWEEIYKKTF